MWIISEYAATRLQSVKRHCAFKFPTTCADDYSDFSATTGSIHGSHDALCQDSLAAQSEDGVYTGGSERGNEGGRQRDNR